MSWTLTTSGSAVLKAGTNANSTIILSGSALADWSDKAEGRVETLTRRKWVDNYESLSTGIKGMLDDICSSLIAKQIISYDTSTYASRAEALFMANVQDDIATEGIQALKDFKSNTLQTP